MTLKFYWKYNSFNTVKQTFLIMAFNMGPVAQNNNLYRFHIFALPYRINTISVARK